MYARISPEADGKSATWGYVEQVDTVNAPFSSMGRWFRELDPRLIDACIGTGFTLIGLIGLYSQSDAHVHYRNPDALGVVLALLCSTPYFVRRRAPLGVLLVSTAAVVALATLSYPTTFQTQMLVVGAYTLGSHGSTAGKRAIGVTAVAAGLIIVAAVGIAGAGTADIAASGAVYMAAYFLGSTIRNRRLYMHQLEERAATAEHERDEEARRAVADERLRIAQELHDVVAHSMGVIAVQAGVGAHVIDQDPSEAKKSLEAIAKTSRSTLTEIRRLLGVLRADERGAYQPAPGLTDLDRLVTDIGAAGVPVTLKVEGTHDDVPPGVDLTAYRIVQEALTNVLKHAGTAHANVVVEYETGIIRLEVTDDGRGVNGRSTEGGHGLLGMRERVGVYGGSLVAGPAPGGGFRVVAELPYGDAE